MGQTTYSLEHARAFEGTIAESREREIRAYRNDEVSAELPYGKMVMKSLAIDDLGMVKVAAGGRLAGVLVNDMHIEQTVTGLPIKTYGNVLHEGVVNVMVENAVTPNSPVRVRIDSAGLGAGSFSTGAAAAGVHVALPNCRFIDSGGANSIVRLEINGLDHVTALA